MKSLLKIILSAFLCVIFTFGGLWAALLAKVDDKPLLALLAAGLFCLAILCVGNSRGNVKPETKS